MTIDVDIAVFSCQLSTRLVSSHFDTRRLFDRTRFVTYIVHNTTAMQRQQISRLDLLAVLVYDGKITISKKTIYILHPCLYSKLLILIRHLFQIDGQTRQYPCIIVLIQCSDSKAAFTGMKAGTIQQMVAKHPHCQTSVEVYMKRLRNKLITPYLLIVTHSLFLFLA